MATTVMTIKETAKTKLTDAQCVYELTQINRDVEDLASDYSFNAAYIIERIFKLMEHFGVDLDGGL